MMTPVEPRGDFLNIPTMRILMLPTCGLPWTSPRPIGITQIEIRMEVMPNRLKSAGENTPNSGWAIPLAARNTIPYSERIRPRLLFGAEELSQLSTTTSTIDRHIPCSRRNTTHQKGEMTSTWAREVAEASEAKAAKVRT